MKLRLSFLASVAVAMVLALVGVLNDVSTTRAIMPLPLQPFAADAQGGISTNQLGQSIAQNATVTKALQGERTTLPWIFSGPGFSVDLDKDITNGAQVGTVWTNVDVACNGAVDYMADNCKFEGPTPNPPYEPWLSPLKWYEATTAVEGSSDEFLKKIMPPFSWLVRHQTPITWLCDGSTGGSISTISVLNTVYAAIPYSPNGSMFVAQTKLGGAPNTPPSLVCLDSPQSSESITTIYNTPPNEGDIDGVCNPATQTCADAGIYGMWTNNTVTLANGGATEIDVEKHIVNNGPEAGNFSETWETESTNAGITAVLDAPLVAPIALPVGEDVEQVKDLIITCTAPANNQWGLVVIKNFLSPIVTALPATSTEDTFLDDNAMVFVVLVKCGTPVVTPEVDKEVSLIKTTPNHVVIPTGATVPVPIDALIANHATTDVLGDVWLVAEVGDADLEVGADLGLAWVTTPNPGAVTVTAPGKTTQNPVIVGTGSSIKATAVNEWPGQADVNAVLNITCPASTVAGLYPVIVKVIDVPTAGFESKPSDNAQRKVITVRCGSATPDSKIDGNGLYARWTILQSIGSTSLNKAGDLRKVYKSPPSIVSDTGYVERTIDLQCFWIDDDGGAPAGADGIISEVESWQDPTLLALGTIGTVDPDGDCAISAAYAQPGHPVDLPTVAGTCDPLQYSEVPSVVTYSKEKDADCDGLVDGVEKAWGSNPLLADSDGDGAPDFVEMFQFTNPVNPDTDNDGLLDKPENNYQAVAAGAGDSSGPEAGTQCGANAIDDDNDGFVNDGCPKVGAAKETGAACADAVDSDSDGAVNDGCPTVTTEIVNLDDNCPSVYNPDQANNDGLSRPGLGIDFPYASNPNQDKMGDACDDDDDNDQALDGYETTRPTPTPNPLKIDTDGDRVQDGAELRVIGGNAVNASQYPDWSDVQQVYYRGCHFNEPVQGSFPPDHLWDQEYDQTGGPGGASDDVEMDPDGDGITCPTDEDNDNGSNTHAAMVEISDAIEGYCYNTGLTLSDTDGDGCEDWVEIMDVNGDRTADSGDLYQMAVSMVSPPAGGTPAYTLLDVNCDQFIDSGDFYLMASNVCTLKNWGGCENATGGCFPEY